jgi:VanZ family protein
MITKTLLVLKSYSLIATILYSLALAVISLVKFRDIPDYIPSFSDKVLHFLMYGILAFLWIITFTHKFKLKRIYAIVWAGIIAVVFGIIIEVLQGTVTNTRVTDQNDIIANTLGVILVILIIVIKDRIVVKK